MMKLILPLFLVAGILVSCDNKSETQSTEQTETSETPIAGDNAAEYSEKDDLMLVIDEACKTSSYAKSLQYAKEDQSLLSAIAYLDENNAIIKIEESYLDGPTAMISYKHFYFNGGVMFATKSISEEAGKSGNYFQELVTFYDEKGNGIESKIRTAKYEEMLADATFITNEIVTLSPKTTMEIINQEGDFISTYQGYVDSNGARFLIVGQDGENGYTSSLLIQQGERPDPTLSYLYNQGKDALGQRLELDFESTMDERGFEYQILTSIALVKTKSEAEAMKK